MIQKFFMSTVLSNAQHLDKFSYTEHYDYQYEMYFSLTMSTPRKLKK